MSQPVSPGNPCPFLRALVAQGLLPAGTPQPIVDRLAKELKEIMQSPEFKQRYDAIRKNGRP